MNSHSSANSLNMLSQSLRHAKNRSSVAGGRVIVAVAAAAAGAERAVDKRASARDAEMNAKQSQIRFENERHPCFNSLL